MGKEKDTATFEWVADNKKDLIYATANDFIKNCSVISKEDIDEAIDLATYFYERVYENKKSMKDNEKDEIDNQKIQYLEEVIKMATDMLKKCKENKK